MALKGKSITVLGAGIGGLAAAVALAQRGARVTVLERAPELAEAGAGIQITPNGSAVIAALGLWPRLRRQAVLAEALEIRDHRKGARLARLALDAPQPGNPHPYFFVHRADLIDVLFHAAQRHGVAVLFDRPVSGVAIGFDQVVLPVENGTQRATRLLVGADGIRSKTREAIAGRAKPRFTGQVAWRAIIDCRYLPLYDPPGIATLRVGPHRHLVTYPVRGRALLNVVGIEERKDWVAEGWSLRDDPANLQAAFADWSPEVRRLLSLVEDVHLWGLHAHEVARDWHQSGAVILGDAAHPTLPFLAQGANMALEDAWVLAAEMDSHDDPQAGFAAYQAKRQKRTARIAAAAAKNARRFHASNPVVRGLGHATLRLADRHFNARLAGRYRWIWGEDVTNGASGIEGQDHGHVV